MRASHAKKILPTDADSVASDQPASAQSYLKTTLSASVRHYLNEKCSSQIRLGGCTEWSYTVRTYMKTGTLNWDLIECRKRVRL